MNRQVGDRVPELEGEVPSGTLTISGLYKKLESLEKRLDDKILYAIHKLRKELVIFLALVAFLTFLSMALGFTYLIRLVQNYFLEFKQIMDGL